MYKYLLMQNIPIDLKKKIFIPKYINIIETIYINFALINFDFMNKNCSI